MANANFDLAVDIDAGIATLTNNGYKYKVPLTDKPQIVWMWETDRGVEITRQPEGCSGRIPVGVKSYITSFNLPPCSTCAPLDCNSEPEVLGWMG